MNIKHITERDKKPAPWSPSVSFPWNEPAFSRRMLLEHLSQEHDLASPRAEKIDEHVRFIHEELLSGRPTRILDLGCGPGLYSSRLAGSGHTCVGVDFSPASLEYAEAQARRESLDCTYIHGDLREVPFPDGFGLAMMLHGEMNVFSPNAMQGVLKKVHASLDTGGLLLMAASKFGGIRRKQPVERSWIAPVSGLFSERPHLMLTENIWDPESKVLIERYYIVDSVGGEVKEYSNSNQAYTNPEYRQLLKSSGFKNIKLLPPLYGMDGDITLTARKG